MALIYLLHLQNNIWLNISLHSSALGIQEIIIVIIPRFFLPIAAGNFEIKKSFIKVSS